MGTNVSRFSDDPNEIYVPIEGLQGALDLRTVTISEQLPQEVSNTFPDFGNDTWKLLVFPTLKKAFYQYTGGIGIVGNILFDVRMSVLIAAALSYFVNEIDHLAGALYLLCWFLLRSFQRIKAESYLEDAIKDLNTMSPKFGFKMFEPDADGKKDGGKLRALYLIVWRKSDIEREMHRNVVQDKMWNEDSHDIFSDGDEDDCDGLGGFDGTLDSRPQYPKRKKKDPEAPLQIYDTTYRTSDASVAPALAHSSHNPGGTLYTAHISKALINGSGSGSGERVNRGGPEKKKNGNSNGRRPSGAN